MDELERQRERAALIQAYRDVFDGEQGQMVLRDLMEHAGMTAGTFAEGGLTDGFAIALRAARRDGMKAIVLRILSTRETPVTEVLDQLEEMIRDAQDRRTRPERTTGLEWADA